MTAFFDPRGRDGRGEWFLDTNENHPDRPTHRDLALLSHIVVTLDERADRGANLEDFISEIADLESVRYLATQRALRIIDHLQETVWVPKVGQTEFTDRVINTMAPVLVALWLDGWRQGVEWGKMKEWDWKEPEENGEE